MKVNYLFFSLLFVFLGVVPQSVFGYGQNDGSCGSDASSDFFNACKLTSIYYNTAYMQSVVFPTDKKDVFKAHAGTFYDSVLDVGATYKISFQTSNLPANLKLTVYSPEQLPLGSTSGMSGEVLFTTEKSGYYYFAFELLDPDTGTHYTFKIEKTASCNDFDKDGYTTCDNDCNDYDAGVHPQAVEKCNLIDDNCNGVTDEGFDTGEPCSVGTGACKNSGILICDGNGGVKCSASPLPPASDDDPCCNGIDDDCDGVTDEDPALTLCGDSVCKEDEICYDNETCVKKCESNSDCSEGYVCVLPEGETQKICLKDSDGDMSADIFDCEPENPDIFPGQVESCNGVDDNCNGETDENFDLLGESCSVGIGACKEEGVYVCSDDGTGVVCNATPKEPASHEFCGDEIDDDCDGSLTNGCECTTLGEKEPCGDLDPNLDGVGICKLGEKECVYDDEFGLKWSECNGLVLPEEENCSNMGEDNDCNGIVDDIPNLGNDCDTGFQGICKEGTLECSNGNLVCKQKEVAKAEDCSNGLDDDCDGKTDMEDSDCVENSVEKDVVETVDSADIVESNEVLTETEETAPWEETVNDEVQNSEASSEEVMQEVSKDDNSSDFTGNAETSTSEVATQETGESVESDSSGGGNGEGNGGGNGGGGHDCSYSTTPSSGSIFLLLFVIIAIFYLKKSRFTVR